MPINPNILLQGQTVDLGQVAQQGLNAYTMFNQLRTQQEEQARKKALEPYQDAVMQNELMKMNITGEYMFGNQIKNDILQKDYDSITAKLAKAKFLSPETKMAIEEAVAAKDDLGLAEMLIASRNNYYDLNPSARPKTEQDKATLKDIVYQGKPAVGRFDSQGNFLGLAGEGVSPLRSETGPTGTELEIKQLEKQKEATRASVKKLFESGSMNQQEFDFINAQIDAGQLAYVASTLQTWAGGRQTTDAQAAARDAALAERMSAYSQSKKKAEQTGKDLATVRSDMVASYGNTQKIMAAYQEALRQIDNGAGTGYFYNLLPTIRDSTAMLENARNTIGLDVAANSKLQPISNSDLSIIMNTAIPLNASPTQVREFLTQKLEALRKTLPVLRQGVNYLESKDASFSGWINKFPAPDDTMKNNLLDQGTNPNAPTLQQPIGIPGSDVPVVPTGGRYTGFKIL